MRRITYSAIGKLLLSSIIILPVMASAQKKESIARTDQVKGVPYFIKVGEGTGGIKLGVSTITDVKRLFGKSKVRDEKSKRGGKEFSDKSVTYKHKGLKFYATAGTADSNSVIYSIEVTMSGARTERDIVIGSSTQAQVILAYGEPSYKSPANISYDTMGVVFEFNNGIVDRIMVSQPR